METSTYNLAKYENKCICKNEWEQNVLHFSVKQYIISLLILF